MGVMTDEVRGYHAQLSLFAISIEDNFGSSETVVSAMRDSNYHVGGDDGFVITFVLCLSSFWRNLKMQGCVY